MATLKRKRDLFEGAFGDLSSKKRQCFSQRNDSDDSNVTAENETFSREQAIDAINSLSETHSKTVLRALAAEEPSHGADARVIIAVQRIRDEETAATIKFCKRHKTQIESILDAIDAVSKQPGPDNEPCRPAEELRHILSSICDSVRSYSSHETKRNALKVICIVFRKVYTRQGRCYKDLQRWLPNAGHYLLRILELCEEEEILRLVKDESFRQILQQVVTECELSVGSVALELTEAVAIITRVEARSKENDRILLVNDALTKLMEVDVSDWENKDQKAMRQRVKEVSERMARLAELLVDEDGS